MRRDCIARSPPSCWSDQTVGYPVPDSLLPAAQPLPAEGIWVAGVTGLFATAGNSLIFLSPTKKYITYFPCQGLVSPPIDQCYVAILESMQGEAAAPTERVPKVDSRGTACGLLS